MAAIVKAMAFKMKNNMKNYKKNAISCIYISYKKDSNE
jgi:hypothetical protein